MRTQDTQKDEDKKRRLVHNKRMVDCKNKAFLCALSAFVDKLYFYKVCDYFLISFKIFSDVIFQKKKSTRNFRCLAVIFSFYNTILELFVVIIHGSQTHRRITIYDIHQPPKQTAYYLFKVQDWAVIVERHLFLEAVLLTKPDQWTRYFLPIVTRLWHR